MLDNAKPVARVIYALCTLYTVVLLGLYISQRDKIIPLTYRTAFGDWGAMRAYVEQSPANLTWDGLSNIAWCTGGSSSPLCSCLYTYLAGAYINNTRLYALESQQQLGDSTFSDIAKSCLRARPTWRKDTCDGFCKVHLLTPVLLICLGGSLFLSRVSAYDSHFATVAAYYIPLFLAVLVVVFQLVLDTYSGILVSLTVLGMLIEISYIPPCEDAGVAYWSFGRYFGALLAVWVAITHQGRDLLLLSAFGFLGFFLGVLAFGERLARRRPCSWTAKHISLYNWVGMCCIVASLALLVQQVWYAHSPASSSSVSVPALIAFSVHSLALFVFVSSERLHMGAGLLVITACVLAAGADAVN